MYLVTKGLETYIEKESIFDNLPLHYIEDVSTLKNVKDELILLKFYENLTQFIKNAIKFDNQLIIFCEDNDNIPSEIVESGNTLIINTICFENKQFPNFLTSVLKFSKDKINKIIELNNKVFDIALATTDILAEKEKIEQLAVRDGLTGLYNHAFFQETLSKTFSQAKRYNEIFSLIILDIDYFKKVNDLYGHLAGDLVLKEFAGLIYCSSRQADTVARYGGEEFAVILPNIDYNGAVSYLDKIMNIVRKHVFHFEKSVFKITFSAGFTVYSDKYKLSREMLEKADKALYLSKENGRNRYTFLD